MTDLIIIGAGPGGYKSALHAARYGLKVTLFEQLLVGGTCLNVGCIPTKTYVHASSFEEAVGRQPQVVEQLRSGVETLLSHPNITLVRQRAAFIDARTVETDGGQRHTAPHIIIATGSSARRIPVEGAHLPCVVDSTGLLALKQRPQRLCIIGAGVIGLEFASVFNRFGAEVTVVETLKECLTAVDADIAKRLRRVMEKQGVRFCMQCSVRSIADGNVTFIDKKGQTESVTADVVLMATGRKANTEGLNLQAAGISLAHDGSIPVDEHFRTTTHMHTHARQEEAALYAVGDVNGRLMLAHAAEYQGLHVVNRILGYHDNIRFDVIPAAVFTTPEAAAVGPAEERLKEERAEFECHKASYRANGKAWAMNQTEGMVKICCQPHEGRILSCHAYGAHAADIVQEATAYINLGATLRQMRQTVHIHPTLSEVLTDVY